VLDNIKCQQYETGIGFVARQPQSYQNELYKKLRIWASYIFIALEINKYTA
jgi:hypothetical protein